MTDCEARRRRWLVCLVALVLLGAAIRLPGVAEPLERDITNYAVIAHETLAGKTLYSEAWDHKPPAVYLAFAAAELLIGYGQASITALGILANTVTSLLLFFLLRTRLEDRLALLGTAFWVLASNSARLEANQPNVEVFLNAGTAGALCVLSWESMSARRRSILGGTILGIASLFKTVALFPLVCLAFLQLPGPSGPTSALGRLRERAAGAVVLLLPAGVLWLVVLGAFAVMGAFSEAWDAIVVFNRYYAGDIAGNVAGLVSSPRLSWHPALLDVTPLVLLAAAAFLVPVQPHVRQLRRLGAVMLAGCLLMLAAPGKFFAHYYQVLLPPVCVLATCALSGLRPGTRLLRPDRGARVATIAAALSLAWLGAVQARQLSIGPIGVSRLKYGSLFEDTRQAARAIARLSGPEEPILVWGSESGIYFYGRRSPAVSLTHIYPLVVGPPAYRERRVAKTLNEIERARPPLIVYDDEAGPVHASRLDPVIQARYAPIERSGRFTIYLDLEVLRRGGQDPSAPVGRQVAEIRKLDLTEPTIVAMRQVVADGPELRVARGAVLQVRSGRLVVVRNGFSVAYGARLAVGVDPSLLTE